MQLYHSEGLLYIKEKVTRVRAGKISHLKSIWVVLLQEKPKLHHILKKKFPTLSWLPIQSEQSGIFARRDLTGCD